MIDSFVVTLSQFLISQIRPISFTLAIQPLSQEPPLWFSSLPSKGAQSESVASPFMYLPFLKYSWVWLPDQPENAPVISKKDFRSEEGQGLCTFMRTCFPLKKKKRFSSKVVCPLPPGVFDLSGYIIISMGSYCRMRSSLSIVPNTLTFQR